MATPQSFPIELVAILIGIALLILLLLALRFGRAIAAGVLTLGILAVAVLGTGALFTQASANRETAKAAVEAAQVAKAASVGQSVSTVILALVVGALGTATMGATGAAGVFWLRWRLAERRRAMLPESRKQGALPEAAHPGQVIYVVQDAEEDTVNLAGIDLSQWGW